MHLLPRDNVYDASGTPPWFQEALAARSGAGRRALVAWGSAFSEFAGSLGDYSGLVAVNCRGLSVGALRDAGFCDVRRFAVFPSLAFARWFIPLDSPAIASAGFCLYTPTRLSARAKRWAARLIARVRVPSWYADQIWIAQRARPPLEAALQPLFPGTLIRLALSSGAPEPARNRKASAAVLGQSGRVLAYAKLAGTPLSRSLLRHEAEVLSALAAAPGPARPVPRLLFAGEIEGVPVAVQSPLEGRPAGARLTPAHLRFLESLKVGPRRPATETSQVARLPARLAALEQPRPDLAAMLDDLMPRLEKIIVPETIVHGDFAPWNLLTRHGGISAFDWEYAELSGLPLMDEMHFRMQVGFLIDGWSSRIARDFMARMAASAPLGLRPGQVEALQVVYLLDILIRLLHEGYRYADMVRFYHEILCMLTVDLREAVPS